MSGSNKHTLDVNKFSGDDIPFENPRSISAMRAGTSLTFLSDGTLNTFAKILVLDFFLASIYLQRVDYYGPLIYPHLPEKEMLKFSLTHNPHLQVPLGLFEPRLSTKSGEAFKEIEDAEGILRSVNNLVDSIEFVLKALKLNDTAGTQQPNRKDRERRIQELKALCSERRNNATRALEALNRQLDYLTKRHTIREANSVKILTILASLYLPLSLSAALLGMQSPFKQITHNKPREQQDLTGTNLFFDFFGVYIVLASATLFVVYAIKVGLWFKSNGLRVLSKSILPETFSGPWSIFYYGRRWRFGGRGGKWFKFVHVLAAWWIKVGLFVTLLVVFLMGMLRTAQSAWDTARWMFTEYLTGCGVLSLSYAIMYQFLSFKRLRNR